MGEMRARLRFLIPATAALAAAIAFVAPPANAGLLDPITALLSPVTNLVLPTCAASSQVFAPVDGDSANYYAFSNNGFEAGSGGWQLSGGAYVGSGNEPWFAGGYGTHSLALPPHASATSPSFCINLLDPAARMFARSVSANGDLQVQVLFHGLTGNLTGILNVSSLDSSDYASWRPTSRISSALALPLLTSYAQIRVVNSGKRGTWQVDDAFVDPLISRIG
jgi:hypothetical protein